MTIGWKPRYSPDGSRLTWERAGFWQSQWLNNHTEIGHNGDVLVIGGLPTRVPGGNELSAGGGKWAAFRTDPVRVYTSWGQTIPGAGCPTLNPDGEFAYVDDYQADLKYLIWNGNRIAVGAITDVRASRQAVVWTSHGRTWGMPTVTGRSVEIQAAPDEFRPIPIDTPRGPWVLSTTHTGFVLRPFGETQGYRFDNDAQAFYPDATYVLGSIVAVFTNDAGVQSQQPFDLTAPRVDLTAPAVQPFVMAPFTHPVLIVPFKDPHGESGAPSEIVVNQTGQHTDRPFFVAEDSLEGPFKGQLLGIYTEALDPSAVIRRHGYTRILIGHDSNTDWVLPIQHMRPYDIPALELYPDTKETITQTVARWHRQALAMLQDWAGDCAVVPAFYCGGGAPPNELWPVARVLELLTYLPAIVNRSPRIKIVAPFAWQRANGITGHPELADAFRALLKATPGVPELTPIRPTKPPKPDPPKEEEPMPKSKEQVRADVNELIRFYMEPDGLNRRARGIDEPIIFHDRAIEDWFAMALSDGVEEAKKQIRTFPEWKEQHQTEEPP